LGVKTHIYIGYILLFLFILQYVLAIEVPFLSEWQAIEGYKRWSGLALFIFIAMQWLLTLVRIRKKEKSSLRLLAFHRWTGALSPAVFFVHSARFGFGYLFILAVTFFFNFFLGLLNTNFIKSFGQGVFKVWYVSHILGSVLITILALLHIWVVFYYK